MKYLFLVLVVIAVGAYLFSVTSCKKEDYAAIDRNLILAYINDNNLNAIEHSSGLFYIIDNEGTGDRPVSTSQVTVNYTGRLLNGFEFDASDPGDPVTFFLSQVIQGWQIGIPLFKEGGSGTLLIPSALGYGSRATGGIPANSVLIFDIDLLIVN